MGSFICTIFTFPIQVILQYVIPVIEEIITTICEWVSTIIETIITIISQVCTWLPWPLSTLCNWVTQVITLIETVWDYICNTIIETIITYVTVVASVVLYFFQIVCVFINGILGIPAWILCISGWSTNRTLILCVKIITSENEESLVTDAAIQNNIETTIQLFEQCNVVVRIRSIERIVKPEYLTTTNCSLWGIFSTWHSWFVQRSCQCCNALTVFFVDDIISPPGSNITGCSYWGENFCRIDAGANNDSTVLAHELGHLLNLPHVSDSNNFMIGDGTSPTNPEITETQCCIIRTSPYIS